MIATLQEPGTSETATNRAGFTSEAVAHRRRLAAATAADRAAELLDRYPDLRLLPGCDWERLGVTTVCCLLYGAASRHFANLQLAAVTGILGIAGVSRAYTIDADHCVRSVLDLMQKRYGITATDEITLEMWEARGRDIDVMRTLTNQIAKYAAAVNFHTPAYVERLSRADKARIGHLLLTPLPHHFRERFVPMAEHRAAQRRRRKAKTDVLSECATAILALMLARYPSAERFIRWYPAPDRAD